MKDNGKSKSIIAVTLAIAMLFELLFFSYLAIYQGREDKSFNFDTEVIEKAGEIKLYAEDEEEDKAVKNLEPIYQIPELKPLESKLRKELKGKEGNWSVYVKVLNNDKSFSINERSSRAASLIKLFVAGAYLSGVKKGEVKKNYESDYNLEMMISESSNDSWEALEDELGNAYGTVGSYMVADYIYEKGYKYTNRDTTAGGGGIGNLTSVGDVGKVLELIYKGEYVSKKDSEELLKYMKNQDHRAKIPAGLPEGVTVANKTGEIDYVENDGAIVFTDKCDYILVVMAEDVNHEMMGVPEISKVSEMVYKYLTGN